ncbi:MAG: hypothetical protein ACE5I1_25720 [bacterium]
MAESNEVIFESPPPNLDDDFWLQQGRKMVEDSIIAVRESAKALMSGVGVIQGIYMGILGFADFVPKNTALAIKGLFIIPLLLWLVALYQSIQVMMTQRIDLVMHSPDDIRAKSEQVLIEKQRILQTAFWTLAAGLFVAFALLIVYMGM